MGLLAAIFEGIDFATIRRVREHIGGWIHMMGNIIVVLLVVLSLLLRWEDPVAAVLPWGLALSLIITVLLSVTGWYGGELVYRHEIAVVGHPEGSERPPRPM
jgi:uncharacterized membrane protein